MAESRRNDLPEWLRSIASGLGLEIVGQSFQPALNPSGKIPLEDTQISEALIDVLRGRGIAALSSFQWEAYRSIASGINTVIAAGTGSGKTEAWLLPIVSSIERDERGIVCIVVYPTKALARDQLERLKAYCGVLGLKVDVYHGDTPYAERTGILSNPPHILVTNPDMLNLAIRGPTFRSIISELRYFVLDDFHVYQGVFGANIAWLIWRMKRIWRDVPVFVGSSATISQPEVLFERLFGERCNVVRSDDRFSEQLHVLLGSSSSRPKRVVAARLFEKMVEEGRRTILFVDSHMVAELIYKMVRHTLGSKVSLHRAGLTAEQREKVEEDLRSGRIMGVVSTPTLELGIDVGELDTVINYGVTSSHSRYVQRAGRAGRRGGLGLIIQLLGEDPISRYYKQKPREFLERRLEPVFLDPDNAEIAKFHLLASTIERPLKAGEAVPYSASSALKALLSEGHIERFGSYYRCTKKGYSYLKKWRGLRGSSEGVAIMLEDGRKIGDRELPIAIAELHPHAIYSHMGATYFVTRLDLEKKLAYVRRANTDNVFTKSVGGRTPVSFEPTKNRFVGGVTLEHGELTIKETVSGYVVKDLDDNTLAERLLEEPISYTFNTKALRFKLEPHAEWGIEGNAEAFHALEHTLISAANISVGLSDVDLGGISTPSGEVYIYDAQLGGSGASLELFNRFAETLKVANTMLATCDCDDGCPKCVFTVYCGNNNMFLSRTKGLHLSLEWLGRLDEHQ